MDRLELHEVLRTGNYDIATFLITGHGDIHDLARAAPGGDLGVQRRAVK